MGFQKLFMTGLMKRLGGAGPLLVLWLTTLLGLAGLGIWLHFSYQPLKAEGPDHHMVEDRPAVAQAETGQDKAPSQTDMADAPQTAVSADPSPAQTQQSANKASSFQPSLAEKGGVAFSDMAPNPAAPVISLGPVPDPALVETTEDGTLPVVGADGRKPWQAYARPYLPKANEPVIALVIEGIGLSQAATARAINDLPADITLAISPYGRNPQASVAAAREAGHEVLLMVPMEPMAYPRNDPGPDSLLVSLQPAENLARLHRVMSRMQGYAGLTNHMGSRFTASRDALEPVLKDIARRGLMIVDSRSSARSVVGAVSQELGLAYAVNDRYIDNQASEAEIDRYLADLELIARQRGVAVGFGRPYPITVARIRHWADGLALRGIALAPVSLVAARQSAPDSAAP
ncbi:hypothetical protein GCM10007972_07690 [Iodidimonas muriae]|uniref:Divergent polysaccharide deacetylase family protein n=2 Tax=Iodidimonas muriae TaxID=261467 RepID=A0ABQ2L9L6_9PROT|nr:hypothetical protein JCM17843_03330 [Kordiimonadales bacterium JCM 17843]GGO07877.1 hypothetical protein GCM10007972_07690 [Iodidimonas muriae]